MLNSEPAKQPTLVFPRLFSPLDVGGLRLRNRIVAAATLTGFAQAGLPTQRQVEFYAELAEGGAALIITESTPVHPTGISLPGEMHGFDHRVVPGMRRIADAIHSYGAAVLCQLWHCGRQASSTASGLPLWAPSAVPCPANREMPKAMTVPEIAEVVEGFALTAEHVKEAGFDGIEVAAGHGYLVHQFLSPLSNRRTDAYGGSVENRRRFLFEVLDAIQRRCGREFIVGVRLSADELLPGGFTVEDTRDLVRRLSDRVPVNLLSISAGTHASVGPMVGDWSVPRGNLTYLAAAVREIAGGLPVITAGRIVEPAQAEAILETGQADLVGLARALLADPFWPIKAQTGRVREIRPCIACNECENRLFKGAPIVCAVNPALGSSSGESKQGGAPPHRRRRVVVVGGGPAGLEAARTAAMGGHVVSLLEAENELGGQLCTLLRLHNRAEFGTVVRFLINELSRLRTDVQLECRADLKTVLAFGADAVVVATGVTLEAFRVQGDGSIRVVAAEEAMTRPEDLGERLVVLDTGAHHQRLLVAAEFLLAPGREIHIVTSAALVGLDISPISLAGILERLRRGGARLWSLVDLHGLQNGSVQLSEVPGGRRLELRDVDSLITAGPYRANDGLVEALRGRVPQVVAVGDCVAPRGLEQAFREGRAAGLSV